jgi:hypothetical protein
MCGDERLPLATTSVRYLNLVAYLRLGAIIPVEGRKRGRLRARVALSRRSMRVEPVTPLKL